MGWRLGQSSSQDLRDRVLGAVDGGMAVRQVGAIFGVSIAYTYKALIRRRLAGDGGINPNRGHHPRKLRPEQEVALAVYMRAHRDHARAGAGLVIGRAWRRAQHRRHLERGAAIGAVVKKCPARGRTGLPRRRRAADAVESSPALHRL